MPPKASTLMRMVMERLGVTGATALARELGMSDYGAPRKIGDWIEGRFAPNYEATMLMLERAGFLNLDPGGPRQPLAGDPSLPPRQQYLLKAAQDGHPPDALAAIFSTPRDEIEAELEAARDWLASWQETRGEEETRGREETEPAEQSPPPEKVRMLVPNVDLRGESGEEAEGETGELTLEIIERRIERHRELAEATRDEVAAFQVWLQERFDRTRGQAAHTPDKEDE